jgi:hypothetical protein
VEKGKQMRKIKKTTKRVLSWTLWLSRGTATMVGFAVMLAVVLGVGTAALAAVPGDPFKLGRTNTIDKLTTLNGSISGALLRINNNGSGPALDLLVEEGEAPMTVDSTIKVNDLNADRVDGKNSTAFVPTETYEVRDSRQGQGGGQLEDRIANCDQGDVILNGGFATGVEDNVFTNSALATDPPGWFVGAQDNGNGSTIAAEANCADLPPLR